MVEMEPAQAHKIEDTLRLKTELLKVMVIKKDT